MDYFDILLAKKLSGGGGGDIEVETLNATENGTYNAGTGKAYNPVVVAVPEPTLIAKNISQNGTYNASDDNVDGYSSVTVDVKGYQIKNIANVPTNIASFTDGTDLPMPKLEIGIEAVQSGSGEPSPSNVRPISGWSAVNVTRCGKNVFDYNEISDISVGTANRNGKLFYKQGKYSISAQASGGYMYARTFNADGSTKNTYNIVSASNITNATFTISNGEYFALYDALEASIATSKEKFETWQAQVELNDAPTTYEPYNGTDYTIQLGDTYYGGKLNVTSGVLTVDRVIKVFDGSENWQKSSSGNMYYLTLNPTTFPYVKDHLTYNIANSYKFKGFATSGYFAFLNDGEYLLYNYYDAQTAREIAIKNLSVSTVEDFKTSLASNNLQVVYEITPLVVQLTPTQVKSLLKDNNIWADSGQIISGQYFAEL